jgi:capsular polysaccharide biosynthesis protein
VKRLWPVAAGIAAGLLAAAVWTWAQPDRYRADARVLVRGTEPDRVMPAVEALAESSLVEENVSQTLHLSSRPDVEAKIGKGGVLTVSVEAGSRERARQLDAEAVIILMQKIPQRFGAAPGINATVLDPAHAAEQTSPTPGTNFLIAGLAGLAAGIAAALAVGREPRAVLADGSVDPNLERRLRKRVDEVAKRERALAKRAGELAARERDFERRVKTEEVAPPPPEPQPEPEPEPKPEPVAPAAAEPARTGSWRLDELESLVRRRSADFPDRVDEWNSYIFFLRDHAEMDGRLPSNFDSLVAEVFEPLLR